jgi:hypothetical protein
MLKGAIRDKDVFRNLILIWRSFGGLCAWRALCAAILPRETTFLEVAFGSRRRPRAARKPERSPEREG